MSKIKYQLPLNEVNIFTIFCIYTGWNKNEDLSVILKVAKQTITSRVDKLEKMELITRKNNKYILTKKAKKLIENNFIHLNSSFLLLE